MAISTVSQKGLDAPLSLTSPTLSGTTTATTITSPASTALTLQTNNGTTALTLTAAGYPLTPLRPSFCAYPNTTSGYSGSPLQYDTTVNNVGGGYSTSTYRFTAPVAGTYFFSYSIWTSNATTTRCAFYKNGTAIGNGTYPIGTRNQAGSSENDSGSLIITLAINDYIDIRCYAGAVEIFGTNYFLGYLIG
jgi:hypothetical protein